MVVNRGSTLIALIICVALLIVRSGGAHVHLCFDGSEPPVSVHFEDGVELSEHLIEVGLFHHDIDLDIGTDSLSKLPKVGIPLLTLAFGFLFLLFDQRSRQPLAPIRPDWFSYGSPSHLRPPLRGPPKYFRR